MELLMKHLKNGNFQIRLVYDSSDECEYSERDISKASIGKTLQIGHSYNTLPERLPSDGFCARIDEGGWVGNATREIRRYNGWRGTTNDRAFYGLGLRTLLTVKNYSKSIIYTFGPDESGE